MATRVLEISRSRSVLGAIGVVAFSAACLLAPIDYEMIGDAGYVGVFLITLITTGALVLPIPYLAVVAKAATFLDPALVALLAGIAAALGELSGYVLGCSGHRLLATNRWIQRSRGWMARYGFLTTAVASFVPNPAFDAVGLAAGALGYPAWRFWLACFLGKTAKFAVVAFGTAYAITWM